MAARVVLRHLMPSLHRSNCSRSILAPLVQISSVRRRQFSVGRDTSAQDITGTTTTASHLHQAMSENKSQSMGDLLFDLLADDNGLIAIGRFVDILTETGLRTTDPRLRETMNNFARIRQQQRYDGTNMFGTMLTREAFKECINDNYVLISRALRNQFVIPDFGQFTRKVDEMYWNCKTNNLGKVADYIPQLARFSTDNWGVAICTVDGQRHSIGDTDVPFTIQSGSKPLTYALALQERGPRIVHQYIGQEPSGRRFNELSLDENNRPHNPMINSGAIACVSLVKADLNLPDRYDYIQRQYKRMAGGEFIGFSNATFLSEKDTADRNFALAYYMKENKCFPEGTNLSEIMDLYVQLCSCEITCESGAVIAATLANGGICPTTGDRIFKSSEVRSTLSLMHSCGMYDYSGQFAFRVGLPGKSGVSGNILLVVPNVMGMCLWSPPLDGLGNSVRGLQFIEELVQTYNFHNYDSVQHDNSQKRDPRRRRIYSRAHEIVSLLFSAYSGDVTAIRRYAASGMDMSQADYDGRTALHLAAAEGHLAVVRFLIEKCRVPSQPRDRWGFTPQDDSVRFGHVEVEKYLNDHQEET